MAPRRLSDAARHGADGSETVVPFSAPTSDERLLELLATDHPSARAMLHDRVADLVHRVVWRVLGPDAEHEDIVHQVFVHVLTGASTIKDPSKLRVWVMSVAVKTVRQEIRKRRFRRAFGLRHAAESPDRTAHVDDHEAQNLVARIYGVLDDLSATDRTTFVLRFVEKCTLQEIATIQGWSVPTAHRRVAAARGRFLALAARDPHLAERSARMAPDDGEAPRS